MSEKELKAYRVSDYEIYAGYTYEDAVLGAMADWGCGRDNYNDTGEPLPMDYEFEVPGENGKPTGRKITVSDVLESSENGEYVAGSD